MRKKWAGVQKELTLTLKQLQLHAKEDW
ncbi:hypothetical protein BN874_2770010 [Candidatus Contendobacter odensis Run_B_J11]|uniref:Uncharacterized protein n=1 Tax=Candidatus Contendobacter odensis Run_B_J11 TaxID=1400861 RepID=A0A7U7GCE1_9GAMM|nr:hypothetical protein BN874_2770010 [Candidatus Contendobacter odensis Run_B_J11]